VTVTGNTITAAPTVPGSLCIGLGGSDLTISRNTCRNAGGAGIGIAVPDKIQSRNIHISKNVVTNGSQAQIGQHAGIELYIACGPGPKCTGGTGAISDVFIENNAVYDEQNQEHKDMASALRYMGRLPDLRESRLSAMIFGVR
jgi:hypothetical protein